MRLMITGHRPPKIGGYSDAAPLRRAVRDAIRDAVESLNPTTMISGMALGVDQDFAMHALDTGRPLHAYVPGSPEQQCSRWPVTAKDLYLTILENATEVVQTPNRASYRETLLERNCCMIRAATHCLAVWDGSPSGTAHAVANARAAGLPVRIIDPSTLRP